MTTSDSTRENCKRQLKTESRIHHTKGRPTCQSGRPSGLVGRPASPLQSPFALRRLVCISKIYTVNFKAILSRFIQRWLRELTQINDVAMPCLLLYPPYIMSPLPPPRGHQSHREPSLIQIKIHHKREISTKLSRCRSRIALVKSLVELSHAQVLEKCSKVGYIFVSYLCKTYALI